MARLTAVGLLFVAVGLTTASGCSRPDPAPGPEAKRPLVVATTTIVADLVRQVAGDRVTIDCLMGDGIDPHSYKATPRDADRLGGANLVVASGLHLEGKLAALLEKLATRIPVVAVADALPPELLLDAGGGLHDPHVWFDARLWSRCVPALVEALVRIDPAGEAEYRRRAAAHVRDLETADETVRRTIGTIPEGRRVLVTAHDAFRYFGRAYGIEVVGVQGTSTESEAGLNDINRLVTLLVERAIPAVFVETRVRRPAASGSRSAAGCIRIPSAARAAEQRRSSARWRRTRGRSPRRSAPARTSHRARTGRRAPAPGRPDMTPDAGPRRPLLEFHDVTVAYGGRPVLWNVDLVVDEPCLLGVIGPNGAGKSTLLKAALGLVPLLGGHVRFFGEPFAAVRRRVGYVPQRETVDWDFPVTAIDVVLMGTYGSLGWIRRPGVRERDLARD